MHFTHFCCQQQSLPSLSAVAKPPFAIFMLPQCPELQAKGVHCCPHHLSQPRCTKGMLQGLGLPFYVKKQHKQPKNLRNNEI